MFSTPRFILAALGTLVLVAGGIFYLKLTSPSQEDLQASVEYVDELDRTNQRPVVSNHEPNVDGKYILLGLGLVLFFLVLWALVSAVLTKIHSKPVEPLFKADRWVGESQWKKNSQYTVGERHRRW